MKTSESVLILWKSPLKVRFLHLKTLWSAFHISSSKRVYSYWERLPPHLFLWPTSEHHIGPYISACIELCFAVKLTVSSLCSIPADGTETQLHKDLLSGKKKKKKKKTQYLLICFHRLARSTVSWSSAGALPRWRTTREILNFQGSRKDTHRHNVEAGLSSVLLFCNRDNGFFKTPAHSSTIPGHHCKVIAWTLRPLRRELKLSIRVWYQSRFNTRSWISQRKVTSSP